MQDVFALQQWVVTRGQQHSHGRGRLQAAGHGPGCERMFPRHCDDRICPDRGLPNTRLSDDAIALRLRTIDGDSTNKMVQSLTAPTDLVGGWAAVYIVESSIKVGSFTISRPTVASLCARPSFLGYVNIIHPLHEGIPLCPSCILHPDKDTASLRFRRSNAGINVTLFPLCRQACSSGRSPLRPINAASQKKLRELADACWRGF